MNGIDFVEVVDNAEIQQTVLLLHFLKNLHLSTLTTENIQIAGGERIKNIVVTNLSPYLYDSPLSPPVSPPESPPRFNGKVLEVTIDRAGDFSRYRLCLVREAGAKEPPPGFDPIFSSVEFSFKVLCPSDFDCREDCQCPPTLTVSPDINYLAKDYGSFRQVMLDRMALLLPGWREGNAADFDVELVELFAYVGDYLSYRQDAIGTEAYLGTARKRISVRRHARLVDYFMHDGCNARTWVHLRVADGFVGSLPKESNGIPTKVLTRSAKLPTVIAPLAKSLHEVINEGSVEVFEFMHDVFLDAAHNEMHFYTWGDSNCCLPKGSTTATLDTHLPNLQAGQVIILQEILGPRTGKESDANPKHRQAVQLTSVSLTYDVLGSIDRTTPDYTPRPITAIAWSSADALSFALCISSTTEQGVDAVVSIALGNNVLVDHGSTILSEELSPVSDAWSKKPHISVAQPSCNPCEKEGLAPVQLRYTPALKHIPVTQTTAYFKDGKPPASAGEAIRGDAKTVLPAISLTEESGVRWLPVHDLIGSNATDRHIVVEVETNGTAYIRFGNDMQGKRPLENGRLTARYRTGNGIAGNIGSNTIHHLVTDPAFTDLIVEVTNPLPATGGQEPETMEVVRKKAPIAFRTQERAVTLQDYENVSRTCLPDIQRSAAIMRWTGSWHTVFLTVDRFGGIAPDEEFEEKLRRCIEKYRMAGQDIEVETPVFVSLEMDITVCLFPEYSRSDVKTALLEVLSNRISSDGSLGLFHPDHFSFAQPVYLSRIYAAVQKVSGVRDVTVTKFQRRGKDSEAALLSGILEVGRKEIARLDNDPNFPEHGVLNLTVLGGK